MLVQFSIIPLGKGSSIGDDIARVIKIVDSSKLPYKINPMGTVVEGSWAEIVRLIRKCHNTVLKNSERVITTISIDDRKGKKNRIEEKVRSVEKRLKTTLKK